MIHQHLLILHFWDVTLSLHLIKRVPDGVLKFNIEHNRAHAVFSCHEHCYAQIMVGRAGGIARCAGFYVDRLRQPCTSHHLL